MVFIIPGVPQEPQRAVPLQARGVVPFQGGAGEQLDQFGRGMQRAGGLGERIATEMQGQLDKARATEGVNAYFDASRKALSDPQGGYLNKVGKDAIGDSYDRTQKALDEARESIAESLDNDEQREAFARVVDYQRQSQQLKIDGHKADQVRNYAIGTQDARTKSLQMETVAAAGGPRFDELKRATLRSLGELGALKGEGEEEQKLRGLLKTSEIHEDVIRGLVDGDRADAARAHLEKYQGEIEPGRASQLGHLIERSSIADTSLRLTHRILGETALPDGRLNMDLALGIADATFKGNRISADVYDATVDRLRREDAARRQQHADLVNRAQDAAEAWLQQNPNLGPQAMPAELYTTLEQNGKLAEINAFADRFRRVTDPQALEEALTMPDEVLGRMSPAELRMRYRGQLSPEDLNVVMAMHRLAGGTATARDTLTLRENLEIEMAAKDAGILPTADKPNEAQSTAYDRWRLAALQARELDPKKPLSEIVREMQQQVVRARGDGTDVNYFALPPEARKTSEIVTPSGRRIPLGAIVDEAGQPMADQILEDIRARNTDIRAENARRAAAGQQQIPEIPETLQAVGAAWERWRLSRIGAGQEGLREEMRLRGMKAYSAGLFGAFAQPGALVGAEDAAALTGLTVPELRERIRAMGAGEHVSPFGSGVTGFPAESVARVVAQQKRGR